MDWSNSGRSRRERLTATARLSICIAICIVVTQGILGQETSALAQEAPESASQSAGPGVPFLAEPVLPEPNLRLQLQVIALSHDFAGVQVGDFILPTRFYGAWHWGSRLAGEASLPLLLTFPGSAGGAPTRSAALDVGNARFGLEWSAWCESTRHRLTLSVDAFLPLSQISNGDSSAAALADAAERRERYALAAALLPNLAPDYVAETLTLVPGVHYRYLDDDLAAHFSFDVPAFLGADFSRSELLHENYLGLRYGAGASYDARPLYPSLDVVGLTTFAHRDPAALDTAPSAHVEAATTVLVAVGFHLALGRWQTGLAASYPFTLGGEATRGVTVGVTVHLELAYPLDSL